MVEGLNGYFHWYLNTFLPSIALERLTIKRFMLARVVVAAVVPRSAAKSPPSNHPCCQRYAPLSDTPGHVAAASSLVQRNSVPSTHMRCLMTANRRATATIARFMRRCRAVFMPQALSHRSCRHRSAVRAHCLHLTGFWQFPLGDYAASDGPYPCRRGDAIRRSHRNQGLRQEA